jgi:hypothetical protein
MKKQKLIFRHVNEINNPGCWLVINIEKMNFINLNMLKLFESEIDINHITSIKKVKINRYTINTNGQNIDFYVNILCYDIEFLNININTINSIYIPCDKFSYFLKIKKLERILK